MTFEELQRQVGQHQDVDLAPLYEVYQQQSGNKDIGGFVRFLKDKSVLTGEALDAAHRGLAVAVTMTAEQTQPQGGIAPGGSGQTAALDSAPQGPRYETIGVLGEGAMGTVHEARDTVLRRRVAMKSLLPRMRKHRAFYSRFMAEMQITAQLDHPHIVPIYGLEVAPDGSVAYAMKLVSGKEYGDVLEAAKALAESGQPLTGEHSLEARLEYFVKVCDAVAFAHDRGIVHRDLKPSNIMIGEHNEVYVMDWGIARMMGDAGSAQDTGLELYDPKGEPTRKDRTRVGQMLGTPMYMSPEQANALNDQLDGRSDLYTLGLILQEAVTLLPAVGGTTMVEVLTNAQAAKREPVKPIAGSVPRELEAIIAKATAKDPSHRYPGVKELAADVRAFLRNEETTAAPDSFVVRIGRWISKHRVHTMAIMLGLLLAGAGGAIGLLIRSSAIRQEQYAAELKRQEMQTRSALSAQTLDNELQRYESALGKLVGAAQIVLSHADQSEAPVYFVADFGAGERPADMTMSRQYDAEVSVEYPAFALSPGVARDAVESEARSLEWLRPAWREAVLTSLGVNVHKIALPAQRQLVTQAGVPIEEAFLTLASGLHVTYPGMQRKIEGDPREHEDFSLAADKLGTYWRGPYPGKSGPTLTVSASVYDAEHRFRGVAGFRVSVARVFEKVQLGDVDFVDETLLVRRDGTIITSSDPERDLSTLPYPEVVAAIARGESGHLERDGKLITFTPLRTLASYFVAITDLERMEEDDVESVAPLAAWATTATVTPPVVQAPAPPPPPPPKVEPEDEEDAGVDADEDAGKAPWKPPSEPKDDEDDFEVKNPFERWENHP